MNKNILIVMGGALAVALVVAILVQMTLGGKKQAAAPPKVAKVHVLVAALDLGIGTELKAGDTVWQAWPKETVFPGAVLRKESTEKPGDALKGRLARDIAKGEPVLKTALISETKGNFVAGSLEPGQRAVAIEVSASTMVGGFIGPGDFVDVILTYKESIRTSDDDPRIQAMIEKNIDKLATETIMQNVKILAVDQSAKRPEKDKIKVGKTVTLAVSAQNAERLALAQQMGELMLTLRGVGDDDVKAKDWETVSDARLISIDDEVFDNYEKMQKDSGINPHIVRIYSGESVQDVPAH